MDWITDVTPISDVVDTCSADSSDDDSDTTVTFTDEEIISDFIISTATITDLITYAEEIDDCDDDTD